MIKLLEKYNFNKKILAHVKDEGFKLNTMVTIGLKLVVICEVLGLEENFQGTCFDRAFLKNHVNLLNQMKSLQRLEICVYQNYTKVFAKMYHLFSKQKKREGGGGGGRIMHVGVFGLFPRKLNTLLKTRYF